MLSSYILYYPSIIARHTSYIRWEQKSLKNKYKMKENFSKFTWEYLAHGWRKAAANWVLQCELKDT